jgi:hypothetical protein
MNSLLAENTNLSELVLFIPLPNLLFFVATGKACHKDRLRVQLIHERLRCIGPIINGPATPRRTSPAYSVQAGGFVKAP